MLALTFAAALQMMNTGNEVTAQSLKLNLAELYFGVADTCYMGADDARKYLKPEHYTTGQNPCYLHLTKEGLKVILKKGKFVITDDED